MPVGSTLDICIYMYILQSVIAQYVMYNNIGSTLYFIASCYVMCSIP